MHCADDGIIEWLQRREQRGAKSGGLLSYGTSLAERDRQAVFYAGRILKDVNPAELLVQQISNSSWSSI